MAIDNWSTDERGNLIAVREGEPVGRVFCRFYDEGTPKQWGAVWFGASDNCTRSLKKPGRRSAEELKEVLEAAEAGFFNPDQWRRDDDWQRDQAGYYQVDQSTEGREIRVSIKKARSGSWYVTHSWGGLLGQGNRPTWFRHEREAMKAFDDLVRRRGSWRWVHRD